MTDDSYSDPRPRREQIAADIRAVILAGKYPDMLPGVKILAEWYDTTVNTVQHALEILKGEGLIRSEKGKGTEVIAEPRTPVLADPDPQLDIYRYDTLAVDVLQVAVPERARQERMEEADAETIPGDVAKLLGLGPNGQAVRRFRVMRVRETDEPVEVDWSYYPIEIAAGTRIALPGSIKGGVQKILDGMHLPAVDYEDRVSTRVPTTQELELLHLPPFVSVLQTLRIVWSRGGKPIEATVMVKGGHRFELLYRRSTH
ncbi:transcriptional regulator, GntR family [Catenulispora acidiphila DSM 44928]|uniref:Transcriptional regulator, GntR family n=1 Tax=Catenulispora acidiphila (strain DSM 44928 / JCM 14897 / NBRC 102108 / NRRL B-24433 / ID139908) TaxID=479433 RepID=C7Q2Q7_CATAD|nr:GntR family transcriptional regulator [Catenulispora acidiphila]ACU71799.1 transcriptional regulator, GntR family [Catenulispora acidiphila DSM 44928]